MEPHLGRGRCISIDGGNCLTAEGALNNRLLPFYGSGVGGVGIPRRRKDLSTESE